MLIYYMEVIILSRGIRPLPAENYIQVPFTMEKDKLKRLNDHVMKNGQTRTGAIRIAIDQYLEKEGEKKDK